MQLRSLISIIAIASLTLAAMHAPDATGKTPKSLRKVEKQVDNSNAYQVPVFAVLAAYEDGFQAILGDAISGAQRQTLIDDTLAFPVYGQAKTRLDRLREAEALADTARHVTVAIPDGQALYYQQEVVGAGFTSTTDMIQFSFDVPFEDREAFANDVFGQLLPMFSKDRKWMRSGTTDPSLNPVYGQLTMTHSLKAGMSGAENLIVSVDYAHTKEIHDLSHGVVLKIFRSTTKF